MDDAVRPSAHRLVIGALGTIVAAQFVLQLDFSIVNVALPSIQHELGFNPTDLQWVVTSYALTFGSLLLLGGRTGDLIGRRRLLLGLALFGLASITSGLALAPAMLVGSRFVQGIGAALVSPSLLGLLTSTYPEGEARNRALAIWQATTAAGASTGVLAGGILTQFLGWRAIFWVNVPIIAALLFLIPRAIPDDRQRAGQRLDVAGALLVTAATAALIYGLGNVEQWGFGAPATLLPLGAAVVLGLIFVQVERTIAAPMVPFSYFASSVHRVSIELVFLMGGVLSVALYFPSLYLQDVLHVDAFFAGLAFLPGSGTIVIISTLVTRRLLDRVGIKWSVLAGLAFIGIGQVLYTFMRTGGGYTTAILPGLVATTIGIGLTVVAVTVAATSAVAKNEQGIASGFVVTAQQVGLSVGLAVMVTIAAARTTQTGGSLADGYAFSYLVGAGVILAALLLVVVRFPGAAHQQAPAQPQTASASPGESTLPLAAVPNTPPCWLGAQMPVESSTKGT